VKGKGDSKTPRANGRDNNTWGKSDDEDGKDEFDN
jgi:hypothetical protein